MEWFLVIALLWGGVKALDKGASWAWRSAKNTARQYATAKPAKPGSAGAKAGRTAAAGWFAAVEGARGFRAGWSQGWPEGRRQAYEWRDRRRQRRQPQPEPELEYEPGQFKPGDPVHWVEEDRDILDVFPDAQDEGVVERVDEDGEPWVRMAGRPDEVEPLTGLKPGLLPKPPLDSDLPEHRWRRAYFAARARKHSEPRSAANREMDRPEHRARKPETNEAQEGDDVSEPTSGNGDSGWQPANGSGDSSGRSGEVTNYPQVLDALKRIEQDATDDLEDAQADEQRAQQDRAEVDGMVASLARLKLDQGTISAVHEIAEAAQAREGAARNRAEAAEQRTATARNAYETVRRNYEQYYEAATSAPAVPEREFAGTG